MPFPRSDTRRSHHGLLTCLIAVAMLLSTAPAQLYAAPSSQEPATPASQEVYAPLRNIVQVSAGGSHTCAVTAAGNVLCWGENDFGQLGDGNSPTESDTPVQVSGFSNVTAVAAGDNHTCAVTTAGAAHCWGYNNDGQLGDSNQPTQSDVPVPVSGLGSGVESIAAGGSHTCAVTTADEALCWGDNFSGQLGNGSSGSGADSDTPEGVSGLAGNVARISAGDSHTCASTTDGAALCWGYNLSGQLGNGSSGSGADSDTPVGVNGLASDVADVSAGSGHSCAVKTDGDALCWGENDDGQLGDTNDPNDSATPQNVSNLSGAAAIAAGGSYTCARTTTGTVLCWGFNDYGQLGNGTFTSENSPIEVNGYANGAASISVGSVHSCAVTTAGGVHCWGTNKERQIGDGTEITYRNSPASVIVQVTCYALSVGYSGQGADPTAIPEQSTECPPNHYIAGDPVALAAHPASGHFAQSWSGLGSSTDQESVKQLTMPAADHTVSVTYAPCRSLTLGHNGTGSDPVAAPAASDGCAAGQYAPGEIITLIAAPGADQRVQSWSGATQDPGEAVLANTLTMPDAGHTVNVTYEPCHTLQASAQGQGEPLQASPVASAGCAAGAYVAGATVTLIAEPADGWTVDGWSGTDNDGATDTNNTLTMPAEDSSVGVSYAEVEDDTEDDPDDDNPDDEEPDDEPDPGALYLPSLTR